VVLETILGPVRRVLPPMQRKVYVRLANVVLDVSTRVVVLVSNAAILRTSYVPPKFLAQAAQTASLPLVERAMKQS